MIVGTEWLIEAAECNANKLSELETLQGVFARVIADLQLKTVGEILWHQFPAEFGITGMVMLTESHLACHTYPEHKIATFNLYCCRTRPEWDWEKHLRELLEAESVSVRKIERGNMSNVAALTAGGVKG
jgi:S-adenosylmethionine decarboxylase